MSSRRKGKQRGRRSWYRHRWPWVVVTAVVAIGAWLFLPFWRLSGQFQSQPSQQPSRLYAKPEVIEPGRALTAAELATRLEDVGYRRDSALPTAGTFRGGQVREGEEAIELRRRRFASPRGMVGGDSLLVRFKAGRVERIVRDGVDLAGVWIDPPLLSSFYGPDLQERRPIVLEDLPEDLILSVLAAEDASFLEHPGLSLRGIVRAAWANLRAQQVSQGGSTLTQQLAKNLYLTHERRWGRKFQEAILAILLEWRYDKRRILQAYLNEIYWGRSSSVDVMGVGAAAWAYFSKTPDQLTLADCALLAGIIQSPGNHSPFASLDAARARRDFVLGRLAQLQWIEPGRLESAAAEEITVKRGTLRRGAPYFADAMVQEARRRFGVENLADAGYILHSTLDWRAQRAAEAAVTNGVAELEKRYEKDRGAELQAALVALDPRDGGIRAYVGGRNYGRSQFDRVQKAKRQAGSAFKPIVYAAAFEKRLANPATFLQDEPFALPGPTGTWRPKNSDGVFHGWVSVRTALEKSYNVPTARLAVDMGLDATVDMAKRLGIKRSLRALPALALGAQEVSPLELATVYSTLAAGGVRREPFGLVAVFDHRGEQVTGQGAAEAARALPADVAYILTKVLQGVPIRGTAKRLRTDGFKDPIAGKTGTSNDRRDSWFAGYSPDLATLVWVGYDDNATTRLSGSRAGVPIWGLFAEAVRPRAGFRNFSAPDGVVSAHIDPRTGGLAHESCGEREREFFLRDFVPGPYCADDSSWRQRFQSEPRQKKDHPFRRWLRMLRDRDGD
ncbi:MAG: PBP1A family penicillin-binding protein [Acidobacteriota bacterium]